MAVTDQTEPERSTPVPGAPTNVDELVAEVDRLLSSDAEGNDEAVLLEQAHRLINDALEGR